MAKQTNKIRLIGLIITFLAIFATIVATWAVSGENIEDNAEAIAELKVEGCKPSGQNKLDVALVQKDIATLQKSVDNLNTEQQAGFNEILKRLPE